MNELASRQCVPCHGGVPPLTEAEAARLQAQLEGWEVVNNHHLRKEYKFADFKESQSFVNRVGEVAEEQWHHPDISYGWGRAEITIWTHKIDGLTESDFILAAKIDSLS
jgi:4a-hydroxytetrahydrobiopterin dehydratase